MIRKHEDTPVWPVAPVWPVPPVMPANKTECKQWCDWYLLYLGQHTDCICGTEKILEHVKIERVCESTRTDLSGRWLLSDQCLR